jgi:cupin 2 domain-containing protein
MKTKNLLQDIPTDLTNEVFELIASSESVKVERIVSKGQVSTDWYDQDEHEWVMVLQGGGELLFADGTSVRLGVGDFLNIPAHCKHKVSWTNPDEVTIWLAIFYK